MKKVPGLKEVLERLKSTIVFKLDKWISCFQFHYIAAKVEKYNFFVTWLVKLTQSILITISNTQGKTLAIAIKAITIWSW